MKSKEAKAVLACIANGPKYVGDIVDETELPQEVVLRCIKELLHALRIHARVVSTPRGRKRDCYVYGVDDSEVLHASNNFSTRKVYKGDSVVVTFGDTWEPSPCMKGGKIGCCASVLYAKGEGK